MPNHDRIQEILDLHLNEGKEKVDVGFVWIKGGGAKITYINPKTKGLPSWVKMGDEIDRKKFTPLEADFEVYNADGHTIKNGYVID